MQFKLNRSKNSRLLTNGIRMSWTKMRVLKLKGNKLYYFFSKESITTINPKKIAKYISFFCFFPFEIYTTQENDT